MSELVLHIGTHKTATTTLQTMLGTNRRPLAAQGIVYPRLAGQDGHHVLATRWINLPSRLRTGSPTERQWRTLAETYAGGRNRLVLSSEEFSRGWPDRVDFAELAELVAGFGQTQVVCYLRNQAEYLQSAYGQMLRRRGMVNFDRFLDCCFIEARAGGLFLDYGALFMHVRAGFAPEAIRFFSFEAACRRPGGITGHFLDVVGGKDIADEAAKNVSPGPVAIWAAASVTAPKPPGKLHLEAAGRALRALVGPDMRPTLLTRGQLKRLQATFEPLNRKAEALAADGNPEFRLDPVALDRRSLHREDIDLHRLRELARQELATSRSTLLGLGGPLS
jgi:hypothetical protein